MLGGRILRYIKHTFVLLVDLNSSGSRKSAQEEYHIAFGTKVAGVQPRKGSGKEVNFYAPPKTGHLSCSS